MMGPSKKRQPRRTGLAKSLSSKPKDGVSDASDEHHDNHDNHDEGDRDKGGRDKGGRDKGGRDKRPRCGHNEGPRCG
jgi:hypothetical protein